jgi:hypothetical protein
MAEVSTEKDIPALRRSSARRGEEEARISFIGVAGEKNNTRVLGNVMGESSV